VRPGDTLSSLAASVYSEVSPLVLDLVMCVNPGIDSIDCMSPGRTLLFPDVSPAKLVRRTLKGHPVIDAVTVSTAAEAVALRAGPANRGYPVSVLPVSVSTTQQWFRVEVGESHAPEEAVRFWHSMPCQEWIFP
jgi:phage tail protein X